MTASKAGKIAAVGFWVALRRLRDQWVLIAFMATALFYARDVYDKFVDLPPRVAELQEMVGALRSDVARIEAGQARLAVDRSPALIFPGLRHAVEDGRPGAPVTVRFRPAERSRTDCHSGALVAYMIDASGNWYSVETDLVGIPQFVGAQELAFGVQVHPRMVVGRAEFLVQVVQDCGDHLQVDSSPRLHFRVLGHEDKEP